MLEGKLITRSEEIIAREEKYGAHNYHPLPVVLERGEGVFVWDVEGERYYDFLAGYSAVNQGHCHPEVVAALHEQAQKLTLTSRAFHNNLLGKYEKYMCQLLGFDKLLPMNSGAEAVETAIKLCRKWAYEVKGIAENEAVIITCHNNFHGRTVNIISFSNDEEAKQNFGPFNPGYQSIPFNDIPALEAALSQKNIAGFLVEPIQGEAGVIIPDEGFLRNAYSLCKQKNVLFIADEIQTGLGRSGKMLACDYEEVQPDILILGKALSAGLLPISAVLANNEIMLCIKPGQHGSTFGGNPLACAVAIKAVDVLQNGMIDNGARQGEYLRQALQQLHHPLLREVRGKGLFSAIEIEHQDKEAAWKICLLMKENGLLAKPTHGDKIRFSPPLIITEEQMKSCVEIISKSLNTFLEQNPQ